MIVLATTERWFACKRCGCTFSSIRNRKFCSRQCQSHNYHRTAHRKEFSQIKCLICHRQFIPNRCTQVCCSEKCSSKKQGVGRRDKHRAKVLIPKPCQHCKEEFTGWGIYCSQKCGHRAAYCRKKQATAVADGLLKILTRRKRIMDRLAKSNKRRPSPTHICSRCGASGATKRSRHAPLCPQCVATKRKARIKKEKLMYHLKKRGKRFREAETIIAEDVFCSNLWMCGVCGGRVDHSLKSPSPLCAELDHIRPISRGGQHTRANVQCTHRICNSAKTNGTQDEAQRGIRLAMLIAQCSCVDEMVSL